MSQAKRELYEAQAQIARISEVQQPVEQAAHSDCAFELLRFVQETGQLNEFINYRWRQSVGLPESTDPPEFRDLSRPGDPSGATVVTAGDRIHQAREYFTALLREASAKDAVWIGVALDVARYVIETGQVAKLADYAEHCEAGAPPYAVAAFKSMEEAKEWIRAHPRPPDGADIIIGQEFRMIWFDERNGRMKLRNYRAIEWYLSEVRDEEPLVPVATFPGSEEALRWMGEQPKPVRKALVSINGALHLASHFTNINHKALFPLSMADSVVIPLWE